MKSCRERGERGRIKYSLIGSVVLSFSASVPALAQEADNSAPIESPTTPAAPSLESPVASESEAPAVGSAPKAVEANDDVEQVVVTARRIEERLQDVPISITVFSQDQLAERNVLSGRDLAQYTPSLSVNGRYGTENAAFSLRGFSQEIRTSPSVAVYFADVVSPRGGGAGTPNGDGAGPGTFFDLQNVQVLNGPQGTLFGRNTTGGAILIVPRKPTSELGGYAEQTLGNYDNVRTQAVVNVPVSETLRVRFGIENNKRDGYLRNTSGIGPLDFQNVNYSSARASVVWDVSPSIENYSIATYSLSDTNGQVTRMFVCNQAFDPRRGPGARLACDQLNRMNAAGYTGRFDVQSDQNNPISRTERKQLINTTSWNATDAMTIKNTVSYAELINDLSGDLFGTAFYQQRNADGKFYQIASNRSSLAPGHHSADQSTFTEELQFQGIALDGDWVWQAGAYYESSKGQSPYGSQSSGYIHCAGTGLECFDVIGENGTNPTRFGGYGYVNWLMGTIDFRNIGIYTQSTYSLTDKLKATAGIRYTNDRSTTDAEVANRYFPGPNYAAAPGNFSTPTTFCLNEQSGHGFFTPVAGVSDCAVHFSKSSDAPTWVVGLDYQVVQDLMLYGKYSRGYRQGGVQPFSVSGFNTFGPEQVDTYEVGFKSSFRAPIKGTFNVAAFYNDFTDQQLQLGFGSLQGAAGNAAIVNAGKSAIKGLELETTLVPVTGLHLSFSYAYLDTKVKELDLPTLDPNSVYNVLSASTFKGDPLPFSIKNKLSASANYTLPLDRSVGQVVAGLTYTWQDKQFVANPNVNPYGEIPSYSLINANLAWNSIAGSNVDFAIFVTNLLDKEYRSGISNSWSSFGFETEIPGEPRMYGGRVRINFGS